MTDQVETKQVTWQDMEVAEEPQQTEWLEGEEPLPVEEPLPKGVLILQGIAEEAWNEAVERRYGDEWRNMFLVPVAQAFDVSPSAIVNTNVLPEDMEKLQERVGDKVRLLEMMYMGAPTCTAHRNAITDADNYG